MILLNTFPFLTAKIVKKDEREVEKLIFLVSFLPMKLYFFGDLTIFKVFHPCLWSLHASTLVIIR